MIHLSLYLLTARIQVLSASPPATKLVNGWTCLDPQPSLPSPRTIRSASVSLQSDGQSRDTPPQNQCDCPEYSQCNEEKSIAIPRSTIQGAAEKLLNSYKTSKAQEGPNTDSPNISHANHSYQTSESYLQEYCTSLKETIAKSRRRERRNESQRKRMGELRDERTEENSNKVKGPGKRDPSPDRRMVQARIKFFKRKKVSRKGIVGDRGTVDVGMRVEYTLVEDPDYDGECAKHE